MKEESSYFSNCLYFSSNALARAMSRLADEAFKPSGLAPSYAFVLMLVNRSPGISPGEIAEELRMQPSTITRFLDKMQAKAFLTRESEGKSVRVYPTSKSQKLDETLQECWETLYDQYNDLLGDDLTALLSGELMTAIHRVF